MAEEHRPLDTRVSTVERTLADIESRLRAIEHGAPVPPPDRLQAAGSGGLALTNVDVAGTFALAGRAFVLLAGAFLLRALAEGGLLPRPAGAALGLAYALALTAFAYRVAPRHAASASSLGICAIIISFPLLWENTARFALMTPGAAAFTLTAAIAIALGVAWRRNLPVLAWAVTIAACLEGIGLLVATGVFLPFTAFLIALGIATLWLGYDREWIGLRWVAALAANLSVAMLIGRAITVPPLESPILVGGTLILLLVGYIGSIAIRTLVRKRDLLPFEVTQAAAVLALGLGGAVLIARRTGAGASMLGPTLLLLAAASYLVALIHRESNARAANYYFYSTLALVFALTGGAFLVGRPAGVLWALPAFAMSWIARRYGRSTLHLHAAAYLMVGALTSGLAGATFAALFGGAAAPIEVAATSAWLMALAVAICWLMAAAPASPQITLASRVVLMVLAILAVAGLGVGAVSVLLMPLAGPALEPAVVATTRTAALAAGAVLVAWLGSRRDMPESAWLLYPLLGWGLVKLLLEDFRVSPPSLLVVALALYGGALIVAPRLAKSKRPG